MKPSFRPGRKLLVASLGVAAISYVACGTSNTGNPLPPPDDAAAKDVGPDMTSGNLAPPPDAGFDATDGGGDATTDGATDAAADAKGD